MTGDAGARGGLQSGAGAGAGGRGFPVELDLRGEVCPFTFARTKLALEALQLGDRLRVVVDHAASAANVPRSLEAQGQDVIEVVAEGATWAILIEKVREW